MIGSNRSSGGFPSIFWFVLGMFIVSMVGVAFGRPSSSSGLSMSRSTSTGSYYSGSRSSSYSGYRSSTPSYSAPVSRSYTTYNRPAYVPPVRTYSAPAASAQTHTTQQTTVINHNSGGGGGGFMSGFVGGAAGAAAANLLMNHHDGYATPMAAPAPIPMPVQTPPPMPVPVPVTPDDTTMYTTPSGGSGVNAAPVVMDYSSRRRGASPLEWLIIALIFTGAVIGVLYWLIKTARNPRSIAQRPLGEALRQSIVSAPKLFPRNPDLRPGLKITIDRERYQGGDDWTFAADHLGLVEVVAVGKVGVNAHLYLDDELTELVRIFFGAPDGGTPREAFFFSWVEEINDPQTIDRWLSDAATTVNGALRYGNALWSPVWGSDNWAAPMDRGSESIAHADHSVTYQKYQDRIYTRSTANGSEYLLARHVSSRDEGDFTQRQLLIYAGRLFNLSDLP